MNVSQEFSTPHITINFDRIAWERKNGKKNRSSLLKVGNEKIGEKICGEK